MPPCRMKIQIFRTLSTILVKFGQDNKGKIPRGDQTGNGLLLTMETGGSRAGLPDSVSTACNRAYNVPPI